MANNKRISEVILKWSIDQASLKGVIDGNKKIEDSLENIKGDTAAVELTAKRLQYELSQVSRIKSIDVLARDFAKVKLAGGDIVAEIERITNALVEMGATDSEIKRLVNEIGNLGSETEGVANSISGGRSQQGRLGRIGRAIFNAPDVPLGAGGFSTTEVSRMFMAAEAAQQAIAATGVSLTSLAVAGGITAVAIAGVALAMDNFNRTIEDSKNALIGGISASDAYYAALRENTTQQTRDQVAQLERDKRFIDQQLAELQGGKDAIFRQAQAGFTDAGARVLELFGVTSEAELNDRITELQRESESAAQTITRLNQGLATNAFAENDLREAREKGLETLEEIAQAERQREEAQIRRFQALNQEIFSLERSATPEALTSRFQALDDERRALERNLPFLQQRATLDEEANKTFQDTVQRLREIGIEFERINKDVTPDVLRRFNDELENTISTIEIQRDNRIAQLQADSQKKQQDILQDGSEKQQEITERANDRRIKAEQNLQRELAKLNTKILDAVGNRDALQVFQLEQQKLEQEQAGKDREAELKEQYDKELKQLNDQTEKRLRTEREGLEKAVNLERQKAQLEIDQRRQAANIIIDDLRTALNAETEIRRAASEAHIIGAATEAERIKAIYATIQQGLVTSTGSFGSGGIRTPVINADVISIGRFGTNNSTPDYSGVPPEFQYLIQNTASAPRDLITTSRSYASPPVAASASTSSATINLNLDGRTIRATSRMEAVNYVDEVLKQAGIA